MTLCERVLKFYCGLCEKADSQQTQMGRDSWKNLEPLLDAKLEGIKNQTKACISSLGQQIAELTEMNKGLVSILSKPSEASGTEHCNASQEVNIPEQAITIQQPPKVGKVAAASKVKSSPSKDHQKKFIRGTVPMPPVTVGSGQDTFAAVARRAYLYIGNINPNTTKESVIKYIRDRRPDVDVVLEELPKRDEALSRAYKLIIDFTLLETFKSPDFWPQGVVIKRFFQSRRQKL